MVSTLQFAINGEILFARMHTPPIREGRVPGILILPGFADTAGGPHHLHVAMARALEQAGYAVLRFDYRGLGESEGDFRCFTVWSGQEDAREALAVLCAQPGVDPERLGIIGYSLGGALACTLAEEIPEVQVLTLLAPVAYPERVFGTFFTPEHLKQREEQGWIDWLGWAVGQSYLSGLAHFDPLRAMQSTQAATLVLHGSDDGEVLPENGIAYAARGATLQMLERCDHQFASVLLQEEVISRTCSWFQSCW